MQSLWAGYGGLRLSDDSLQIASAPRCPPNVTRFQLRNVEYRGVRLRYEVVEGAGARVSLEKEFRVDKDLQTTNVQHHSAKNTVSLVISVNDAEATPITAVPSAIPVGMTARIFAAEQRS